MTVDDLKSRAIAQPFTPFKVRTSDGHEFPVPHPEFIYTTPKRVVIARKDGYVNVLDPLHIVSIEEVES